MKKYIFLAASVLTLASCTSDDFMGNTPGNVESNNVTISFGGETGKISRADDKKGKDAADALSNNFIVFGTKTKDNTTSVIYNYYNVNWTTASGASANAWVYAGQDKSSLNDLDGKQSLKYWDYSASSYDFIAFSLGGKEIGKETGKIKVTKIDDNNKPTYTLSGKIADLQGCFIADKMSVKSTDYGKPVEFTFRSTGTKVSVSIYETIPGYSIKSIKFYEKNGATGTSDTPILYANTDCIPVNEATGSLKVTFNDLGVANATWTHDANTETTSKTSSITFDQFELNTGAEDKETTKADDKYISRTYGDATSTNQKAVTTCTVTGGLTLKADYTLIATDGSGEEIKVTGACVNVPEKYTTWNANYIYDYIFKITENTNGSTGGSDSTPGLKPIVFDAIVTENEDGSQITETTFKEDGSSETNIIGK